jgi:hypothetical protein
VSAIVLEIPDERRRLQVSFRFSVRGPVTAGAGEDELSN